MTNERLDPRWDAHLDQLGAGAAYPATPDLAPTVLSAVRGESTARRAALRPAPGWAPRFALATALALLVLTATIAIPSARTAIGEFFGLVEGEHIEIVPTQPPSASATPLPTPPPLASLGAPFTLEQVQSAVGFRPALPNGEEPEAVFLVDYEGVAVVVFQYPDYDLWQARDTGYGYFSKTAPPRSVEPTAIGSVFGYWVSGGSHVVRFIDADGNEVIGSERTIDRNTLIWRGPNNNRYYRLETSLPLEEAIAVAELLP